LRGWDYRKDVTPGSCVKDEEKTPKRGIQRRDFFEDFSSGEMGISRVGKKQGTFFAASKKSHVGFDQVFPAVSPNLLMFPRC
jgi:hypothetical protein